MTINLFFKMLGIVTFCSVNISSLDAQTDELRYKVLGKVIDGRSKKELKRIPFVVLPYNRKVETDAKGAFLFNMPAGKKTFVFDYYPFDKKEITLNLQSDTTLIIELKTPFNSQYIEEV